MIDSEQVASVASSEEIAAILLVAPAAALSGYLLTQPQRALGHVVLLPHGIVLFAVLLLVRRAGDVLSES